MPFPRVAWLNQIQAARITFREWSLALKSQTPSPTPRILAAMNGVHQQFIGLLPEVDGTGEAAQQQTPHRAMQAGERCGAWAMRSMA